MTEYERELALCEELAGRRLHIYHVPGGRVDDRHLAGELWFSASGECMFQATTPDYEKQFEELLARPFALRIGGMNDSGALWDGSVTVQRDRPHTVLHLFSASTPIGSFDRDALSLA